MVQTDYDDNGDIEYTNTCAFSIKFEKRFIYVKIKSVIYMSIMENNFIDSI